MKTLILILLVSGITLVQAQHESHWCEVTQMKDMQNGIWGETYAVSNTTVLLSRMESGEFEITVYTEEGEPYLRFININFLGELTTSPEYYKYFLEDDHQGLYPYGADLITKSGVQRMGLYCKKPLSQLIDGKSNYMYLTYLQDNWSTIMVIKYVKKADTRKKQVYQVID